MRFLMVCGGTAGHINPALAVASKLGDRCPGSSFIFAGSGREMERRLIPAEGYELKNITITGFTRGLSQKALKKNIVMLRNLALSRKESRDIINEFKPDAVIGTGGYVCFPVISTAARMGIPTVLHESNAVPGLTTKMLSGVADRILVAFPEAGRQYNKPEKVVVTGTPVRRDFLPITRQEARSRLNIAEEKPLVVSFWGSLGADGMNEKMADFIKLNAKNGHIHHIHATGSGQTGTDKMMKRLNDRGVYGLPAWEDVRPYINDMGLVMTAADLIICRAGASTLAELTSVGRASILVPSPNVTNNHQEKNAREVERAGGAVVLTEAECSGESIYDTVLSLVNDSSRLDQMEKCATQLGYPDACDKIADVVLSLIN